MDSVADFSVHVPDEVLHDLRERLHRTRSARRIGRGWAAGTDPDYLADFLRHWEQEFDWRSTERNVNRYPQKLVTVGSARLHVIHVRAERKPDDPPAVPLLLIHGWPSSFFEFLPAIESLTDPASSGGDAVDAFDVIIPSLPGFGFSSALEGEPTEPSRIADRFARMMDVLGYEHFVACGGDIRSHVTNFLGATHPDHVIGVFTHHPNLHPDLDPAHPPSVAEQEYLHARERDSGGNDYSYAAVQAARPNSLAPGLSDSPAGLAAWILEKYREWGDGDLEAVFDRATLMNVLTLYWATNSIATSFLPYFDDDATPPLPPVDVPAGLTLTPEDAGYPREFAARTYRDIRQWRGPERGGHFLALEQPDRLVRDLRDFVRPLRG